MNKINFFYFKLLVVCSFFVFSSSTFAQDFTTNNNFSKLDSLLSPLQENIFMGSISVNSKGKIVFEKSYGLGRLQDTENTKLQTNTIIRIGSMSEIFTMHLIFQLIEQNKIKMETTIQKFFPSLKNAELITIKQLLEHKSGIYNIQNDITFDQIKNGKLNSEQILNILYNNEHLFSTPNKTVQYNISNFILLSIIIEKVENANFSEVLQSQIFEDLDMKHTFSNENQQFSNHIASSYYFEDEWKATTNQSNVSILKGWASISSIPADINKYLRFLFSNNKTSTSLAKKILDINRVSNYGLTNYGFQKYRGFASSGNIDAYQSFAVFFPEQDISITILSNGINFYFTEIIKLVLNAAFNLPLENNTKLPKLKPPIKYKDFIGNYYSEELKSTLKIWADESQLKGQLANQPEFGLEHKKNNIFTFDVAGIELKFLPDKQVEVSFKYSNQKNIFDYVEKK